LLYNGRNGIYVHAKELNRKPTLEVAPTIFAQSATNKLRECCVHVWCCPLAIQNVHTTS